MADRDDASMKHFASRVNNAKRVRPGVAGLSCICFENGFGNHITADKFKYTGMAVANGQHENIKSRHLLQNVMKDTNQ